jgi:hypothetical protein
MENMLRTVGSPGSKQTMLLIFKRAASTDGHKPRVSAPV